MKFLPCDTCRRTALAVRPSTLHCLGTMHDSSVTYLCKRCGRNTTLTSTRFAALSEMTDAEIRSKQCDLTPDESGDPGDSSQR